MNKKILNRLGLTLIEMLTTIVVGSIVTMILMQILVMSVNARTQLEIENKMLNESYYMAEIIRQNIFELEAQELELIEDSATRTEIQIRHLYDFTTNASNEIIQDFTNQETDTIVLDKTDPDNIILYYNGVQLNESGVLLVTGSTVELISLNTSVCDLAINPCEQGILKLTLMISIELDNGARLSPQTYITTILV
jgi:prepilin-type N-terminal cleavage/methylation domain-containing protein